MENAGINQFVDGTVVVFDPTVNEEGRCAGPAILDPYFSHYYAHANLITTIRLVAHSHTAGGKRVVSTGKSVETVQHIRNVNFVVQPTWFEIGAGL